MLIYSGGGTNLCSLSWGYRTGKNCSGYSKGEWVGGVCSMPHVRGKEGHRMFKGQSAGTLTAQGHLLNNEPWPTFTCSHRPETEICSLSPQLWIWWQQQAQICKVFAKGKKYFHLWIQETSTWLLCTRTLQHPSLKRSTLERKRTSNSMRMCRPHSTRQHLYHCLFCLMDPSKQKTLHGSPSELRTQPALPGLVAMKAETLPGILTQVHAFQAKR